MELTLLATPSSLLLPSLGGGLAAGGRAPETALEEGTAAEVVTILSVVVTIAPVVVAVAIVPVAGAEAVLWQGAG